MSEYNLEFLSNELKHLPSRTQVVLQRVYVDKIKWKDIASEFNVSISKVRHIKEDGISTLFTANVLSKWREELEE